MANPIIDRAKAHFAALDRILVEVPEWGDESGPLVIHGSPWNMEQKGRLSRYYKESGWAEMVVRALIMKATDAQGKPLFTLDDRKHLLLDVDPAVLDRVGAALMAGATPGEGAVEDAAKN